MTACKCPACIGRATKWTTTPEGWTDASVNSSLLPELPEHLLTQQCKAEVNIVTDGVFLWVNTHGTGHSFVTIHTHSKVTVYTYGRYGDMPQGNPLVGEGILLRMSDNAASRDYLSIELYEHNAEVFKILDTDKWLVDGYLSGIFTASDQMTRKQNARTNVRQYGRVIDQYDLTGNNCTTHSVKAVRLGGSRIFDRNIVGFRYSDDFTIPNSLLRYMQEASADISDMRSVKVTDKMKNWFPNTSNRAYKAEGLEDSVMGGSANTSGYTGSSTGYSGGTSGGVLGGSYEPTDR